MAAFLQHMALQVKDLDWHIDFFQNVFGMEIESTMGEVPNRKVWLSGGLQLNENLDFANIEGRADHLGIVSDDYEETLKRAYERGAKELSMGHNWFQLQSGICIELVLPKND